MRDTKKTPRQPPFDRRTRTSFTRKPVRFEFPPGTTADETAEAIRKLHETGSKGKTRTRPPRP